MNEAGRTRRGTVAAIATIAATYGYFLLFAEFALLGLAERWVTEAWSLRAIMAVLGAGGVAGSVLAAWRFRAGRARRSLAAGFAGCAAAAAGAALAKDGMAFVVAAGGVGLALGWLTVTLASGLRATLGVRRLGWGCGWGTGLAYAWCNVPWIFTATPAAQTWIAVGMALAGAGATGWLEVTNEEGGEVGDYTRPIVALWVTMLLALVWLDSAAFYVIQHAPVLKTATWTGWWTLGGNALTHLGAAVATGWLLDRGAAGRLAGVAGGLLVAACAVLGGWGPMGAAAVIYTAGVSIYSTVLVYYPARGGRPWIAAGIYAIAGWGGSALGIGMAQDLRAIPAWLLFAAGGVMAVALGVRWRRLAALVAVGVFVAPSARAEWDSVTAGREVYVSEGCMHCHSQFVRPRVAEDVVRWGPAPGLERALADTPPLPGNRRQGPDLTQVGNRRTAEWQRQHLQAPRAVVPGSRMPGYAYLFSGDGRRGEALVAYLTSLGRETLPQRVALAAAWQPSVTADEGATRRGAARFAQVCANCHGEAGAGDGPLAAALSVRPPDFTRDDWRRVNQAEAFAVERIVKFGLPGSPMAGHEYLSDADVVALAAYVRALHRQGAAGG